MFVKMLDTTWVAQIGPLVADDIVETKEEFGQHLIDQGIAEAAAGPATASRRGRGGEATRLTKAQQDWALQEMEIAARHGDVETALRLDRIKRGEEEVPVTATETPRTNPPTEEPVEEPAPENETPEQKQAREERNRQARERREREQPQPTTTGASARRTLAR